MNVPGFRANGMPQIGHQTTNNNTETGEMDSKEELAKQKADIQKLFNNNAIKMPSLTKNN